MIVDALLQGFLGLAFLPTGASKLIGVHQSQALRDRLHITPWFWKCTGAIEVIGGAALLAGFWLPKLTLGGTVLLGLTMIGAVLTHLTRRDSLKNMSGALLLLFFIVVFIVLHRSAF